MDSPKSLVVSSEPQVTAVLSSPMSFSSFFIVFVFMYFQTIFHYVFNISLIVSHIQLILLCTPLVLHDS